MFNCRKSVPIRPTDIEDIGPVSLLLGDNPGWLAGIPRWPFIAGRKHKAMSVEGYTREEFESLMLCKFPDAPVEDDEADRARLEFMREEHAVLLTPIAPAAPNVHQVIELELSAPLRVAFTLRHRDTKQLFRVWNRISDLRYEIQLLPTTKYTVGIAKGEELTVGRYPLV